VQIISPLALLTLSIESSSTSIPRDRENRTNLTIRIKTVQKIKTYGTRGKMEKKLFRKQKESLPKI